MACSRVRSFRTRRSAPGSRPSPTTRATCFSGPVSICLARQFHTPVWVELGALTVVMSGLIFVIRLHQRRTATSPHRPAQFDHRVEGSLDADAANPISLGIRKVAFLAKKGVMARYVLFTVLGLLPLFVGLAAFGSVLTFVR